MIRFFLIAIIFMAGCANDAVYRMHDPKTCISTGINGCTDEQASKNRVELINQCKELNGTPSIKKIGEVITVIMGFECLMPDGSVRDLYAEKFEKETGKKVFN